MRDEYLTIKNIQCIAFINNVEQLLVIIKNTALNFLSSVSRKMSENIHENILSSYIISVTMIDSCIYISYCPFINVPLFFKNYRRNSIMFHELYITDLYKVNVKRRFYAF